ncbi:hypothetical protein SLS56_003390 [Neofusicoccum ribis]|uniref:Uncharacterized protein n=1 Tax=Neofusicoccum ribis TaxID=45134 RepID=A0ABR3SZE9_9PEZI
MSKLTLRREISLQSKETRLYKDGEKVLKTVVEKGVKRDKEFKVETFRYNDSRKTWEYKLILDGSAYSEDGKDWFQENDLDMA